MFYAAILLGLAGSLHCAGMCSPLMMAVTAKRPFLLTKIVYNTGRILIYGLLGVIAAGLGSWFYFTDYQQVLSFALGSILVLFGLVGISGVHIPFVTPLLLWFTTWVKRKFGWAIAKPSLSARFLMGMLNGLLPCGLTYLALTACFILPRPIDGFVYMLLFGFGTWPVMIGVGWIIDNTLFRKWIVNRRLTQAALVVAGVLLIGRVWWMHGADATSLQSAVGQTEVLCP